MPGWRGAIRGTFCSRAAVAAAVISAAALAWATPANATPIYLTPINISDAGEDAFEPQVVVDQSGNEHHVWTSGDGSNTRIQYRLRDQAGNFGPVQTVSAAGADASQPDIDIDDNGNAVAVWTRSQGAHLRVEAAGRPAGGVFGAVQTVSASGRNAEQADMRRSTVRARRWRSGILDEQRHQWERGRSESAVRPGRDPWGAVTISDEGEVTHGIRRSTVVRPSTRWVSLEAARTVHGRVREAPAGRNVTGPPKAERSGPAARLCWCRLTTRCTMANRLRPSLPIPAGIPPVRSWVVDGRIA